MKKTPLHAAHRDLGARMVEFGGWEMPVQYRGVIEEHLAVRRSAGLFDVSHMGEIAVRGREALDFLQYLTCNDVSRLADGQVQYNALCYTDGGTVDDVTVYRHSAVHFMLCVNAANTDKDFAWMEQVLDESGLTGVALSNLSEQFGQLALQGPHAVRILSQLTDVAVDAITYYHFREGEVAGVPMLISRTGYTGEDGFELYLPAEQTGLLWSRLLEAGAADGLVPVGLGARDTLRLEKGYPLYGHELSAGITPLEAGLGWIVKLDKGDFVGRAALATQQQAGLPRRRAGLLMAERGIPREGYPIHAGGRQVGVVTSGTMSPSLQTGIALALVEAGLQTAGTEIDIEIRNRRLQARAVKLPFVS
ncbi:MAG: glycine cleavage system aminomethyltransferase GcvT [Desulfuromonadales bacterium]|nr:glycine cleavage system aminomethyltransferase GcvT [Desulfuromonadales bacterium]